MTAIYLHLLNVDIDRINVGDRIRCISIPHNIDLILIVKSIEIDIDAPENTKINLVSPDGKITSDKTITSDNKDNEKNVTKVKNDLDESYPTYEDLNNNLNNYDNNLKEWTNDTLDNYDNDLKKWIDSNYVPKSGSGSIDLSPYAKIADVNTAFNELAKALEGV